MVRIFLIAGIAVPIVYFASQVAAMALNPGFDIATQQPSELGCCGAQLPLIANAGFLLTGVFAIAGGVGLSLGLRKLGGNAILAALAGLGMILFGIAMTMSGLFPLPDPLHYGFGLFPAGLLAPLFGALALKDGGGVRWIVLAAFAASAVLVALMFGVGGVVTESNLGYFSRAVALVAFPAMGLLCWHVRRRLAA
ncbi:DUF998 domain-containing protein [Terricaulis sp.]|uniref:DUF998 domain-containing protein n=1 Tax=Terricaulis sp. TaxID=2768686 RepID=UPI002AC779F1|nr:DUF998 domain-containing protein [Terricaulis sp.]MDZ4692079.1 DUF998 domain-containing protein [Terricaulis sp.]